MHKCTMELSEKQKNDKIIMFIEKCHKSEAQKVVGGYVRRKMDGYFYGQAGTEVDGAGND